MESVQKYHTCDPGVVDKNVEFAELVFEHVDEDSDGLEGGEIERQKVQSALQVRVRVLAQFEREFPLRALDRLQSALRVPAGEDDRRAAPRESLRRLVPDSFTHTTLAIDSSEGAFVNGIIVEDSFTRCGLLE